MYLLVDNILNDKIDCDVPSEFVKNKYSRLEYQLIRQGLKKHYNIDHFEIVYSNFGKPYLNNIDINISISHDENLVCVLLSRESIGVDLQFIKPVSFGVKDFLNIPVHFNNTESIIEFSKREATIKLFNLKLIDINSLDLSLCNFEIYEYNNFVITCAILKK